MRSVQGPPPASQQKNVVSNGPSDLDFDPMTLILKVDLDMIKMSYRTKYEVFQC